MEFAHSVSGWSYLSPQAGRPALFFDWTLSLYAEGGGYALIWWDGPVPDTIEVSRGQCLLLAIMERAMARQRGEER